MPYGISSRDYLLRARHRLDDNTKESLFYAAFELRAAVEARLEEYLEAQDHVSASKKKGWQVAKLAKNLESAFKGGNRIVEITVTNRVTEEAIGVFYYTPVDKALQKKIQRLGDLLHSAKRPRPDNDPWWQETRAFLEDVYADARRATRGTLLGPPLLRKSGRQIRMTTEVLPGNDPNERIERVMASGGRTTMKVAYLDTLPIEM